MTLLLFQDPALKAQPRHEVAVGVMFKMISVSWGSF